MAEILKLTGITFTEALAEALTEYTTNLDEVALIEAIASRAFRQWLAENGLKIVPTCSTAAMSEATAKYRAEALRIIRYLEMCYEDLTISS